MSLFTGEHAALYSEKGRLTSFSLVPYSQVGTTDDFVITDPSTRIVRAFDANAAPSDFTSDNGSVVGVEPAVAQVTLSGYTGNSANISAVDASKVIELEQIGYVQGWSLTVERNVADVSSLGDKFSRGIGIIKNWSVNFDRLFVDNKFVLGGAMEVGSGPYLVSLFVSTRSSDLYRFVGYANIVSAEVTASYDNVTRYRATLQGYGRTLYRTQAN